MFCQQCLWCQTNNSCTDYPVSYVIPPASVCKLSQARWGVCWGELNVCSCFIMLHKLIALRCTKYMMISITQPAVETMEAILSHS